MQKLSVLLAALAIMMAAHGPLSAAGGERALPLDDPSSLASPDYEGYRPAWADPYAEPGDLGVNDDPTPFYPSDVDSGPSLLDRDD